MKCFALSKIYTGKSCIKYTQQQKKREHIIFILNWLKIKYIEVKKYILHVKLTVQLVLRVIYIFEFKIFYFQSI